MKNGSRGAAERRDELRHHPLRLRRNEKRTAGKHAASGEHPGFVRCLFGLASGIGSKVVLARSGCSPQKCVDGF